ncbi:hypothetical protein BVC80_41g75 [Macleaya cordata]|uniref:Uncharacterized protein n=1 Tax=Macleaya cordata TaxID=56857 RepID=A0A200QMQ1_MACCD|nr:hypothetical protein BVC80_41g75 [Macleaya cordata]
MSETFFHGQVSYHMRTAPGTRFKEIRTETNEMIKLSHVMLDALNELTVYIMSWKEEALLRHHSSENSIGENSFQYDVNASMESAAVKGKTVAAAVEGVEKQWRTSF